MTTSDQRIAELEAKVARLQDFNQILMTHIIAIQGTDPVTPEKLHTVLIDLSDAVWQKYRYSPRL